MIRDDPPPSVRIRKKEPSQPGHDPGESAVLSQMGTAVVASLRGTVRGFRERDAAALAQAARNGRIVEELFFQSAQGILEDSPERRMLKLAGKLSELAESASQARQGADEEMDRILDQIWPYLESILEDLTPSPARRFMPSPAPPPRKKLTDLKERTVAAMAKCGSPEAILSGIRLFRVIEIVEDAIPSAVQIGAVLFETDGPDRKKTPRLRGGF